MAQFFAKYFDDQLTITWYDPDVFNVVVATPEQVIMTTL